MALYTQLPQQITIKLSCMKWTSGFHTGFLAWGGGGGIYWCINEGKCERRGLGASPSLAPPPPQNFFVDLASLAKFDKFNAYAHQGCI